MKFRAEEPKVYNDWEEVAKARASIASRGTPLQYRLDGQWEARRRTRRYLLVYGLVLIATAAYLLWVG